MDVQPFDADAGLLSGRFEDVAGTVSGRYTPVYALTSEDLAVITTDVDTPFYTVASAAPKPGDQLFWVAYNFNAKKRAYEPLPLDGRVISVVAGMVIVDTRTPPGSSGSCVLNAEGQVVGVVSFGHSINGSEVAGIVGVWPPWVDSAEAIVAKIQEARQ